MDIKVDSKLFKHLGHDKMRKERKRKRGKRRNIKKVEEVESRAEEKISKGIKGRDRR